MRLVTAAGKGLWDLTKRFGGRMWKYGKPQNFGDAAAMYAPDLIFGGVAAATTPGDATDKAIAGIGAGLGGVVGGMGARGLLGSASVAYPAIGGVVDFAGSYAGDVGASMAADQILRMKNNGMTPWEQLQAEQYEQMKEQAKREIYQQLRAQQNIPSTYLY